MEEITKKEIHKALRGKVATEQIKMEIVQKSGSSGGNEDDMMKRPVLRSSDESDTQRRPPMMQQQRRPFMPSSRPSFSASRPVAPMQQMQQTTPPQKLSQLQKEKFKSALDDVLGTRGAYLFDKDLNVLGKVPVTELAATVKSVGNIFGIVMDAPIDRDFAKSIERTGVQYLVSMESKLKPEDTRVTVVTDAELV